MLLDFDLVIYRDKQLRMCNCCINRQSISYNFRNASRIYTRFKRHTWNFWQTNLTYVHVLFCCFPICYSPKIITNWFEDHILYLVICTTHLSITFLLDIIYYSVMNQIHIPLIWYNSRDVLLRILIDKIMIILIAEL